MPMSEGDAFMHAQLERDAHIQRNRQALSRLLEFERAKAERDELEALQRAASERLRAIPGIGTGPMGLTPDAIKFGPEYRQARAAYERATSNLKRFVVPFLKRFGSELAAERRARRASGKL